MRGIRRRNFLKATGGVAGLSALGGFQIMAAEQTRRLRVAVIGCGIRGASGHIPAACEEQLVAVVDPDPAKIKDALVKAGTVITQDEVSKVKQYSDYRKLFDEMGKDLDAVIIATPNHQHAIPALLAIRNGIHVYVEKPMSLTIAESRQLAMEARRYGVVTQMGQQGHAGEGCRRLCEFIWAGAIGDVKEVYCWSNRANGLMSAVRPAGTLPAGMEWDTWIGPAAFRDYHAGLHPHGWHAWFDFGNGSLGNMGCHILDPAYWALKLGHPDMIEVEDVLGGDQECYPVSSRIRWDFPAREGMKELKLYWYDGLLPELSHSEETVNLKGASVKPEYQNRPPLVVELEKKYDRNLGTNGTIYVGTKGIMTTDAYGDGVRILPEEAHRAFKRPPAILPRIKGTHQRDFFRACRGGEPPSAHFDYSAHLNELALLGCLAIRAGKGNPVAWDGVAMRCTNQAAVNSYLKVNPRSGWGV